ncbi:hypothetical protein D3C77_580280 [compost metagenome]
MQDDEHAGQQQQNQERTPTLEQLAYVRFQADAGKEIQQQGVANLQVELDLDVQTEVQKAGHRRTDKTADYRLGNAVLAQHRSVLDKGFAEEQQENGEGKAHKAVNGEELGGHQGLPSNLKKTLSGFGPRLFRLKSMKREMAETERRLSPVEAEQEELPTGVHDDAVGH